MKKSKRGRKASRVKQSGKASGRVYTVLLEMRQVFTDELLIVADSNSQARRIAKAAVTNGRVASLEFQDLESTTYRLVRVVPHR